MNKYQIYINGTEYTNATYPFKYGQFLDEQLDYATLTITCVSTPYFVPTTPVKVVITSKNEVNGTLYEQTKTFRYVVAQDNFREVLSQRQGDVKIYTHELTLIEPTKLLEGIPVESLCFTNAGGREYAENKQVPALEVTGETTITESEWKE